MPAEAITDPVTADRARHAARRLAARARPLPAESVLVTAAHVRDGYWTELHFTDGSHRIIDLEPYLWGSTAFEPIRADYRLFLQLGVAGGTVAWPNGAEMSADLLYLESDPVRARHP